MSEEAESRLFVSPISKPLANDKLTKKLLKLVKKAASSKSVRKGVKETVKACRSKKLKGLVVIAADISPIDVLSHLPLLCEDRDIPYMFVPSREAIGGACATKRPTSCVYVENVEDSKYADKYEEAETLIRKKNPYL